jgi:acyl-CoA synthetase (AMP-forming)/AMP-acid ligase II
MGHPFRNPQDILDLENKMPLDEALDSATVYQRLCKTRDLYPDRPAVSFQLKSNANSKATTLSWTELTSKVTQAANLFRSLGVGPKDAVAYLLPTTHETLITLMGGMTSGIVAPINPTLEPESIAALLRETNAKVLVTLKAFPKTNVSDLASQAVALSPNVKTVIELDLLPHISGISKLIVPLIRPKNSTQYSAKVIDFDQSLASQDGNELTFEEDLADPYCALFHTGGTTGMPKIAQHRHTGVLYNGWIASSLIFSEDDIIMCPLPLFHVFAAYPIWAGCLVSGAHMVLPTPAGYRGEGVFDNFWKLIERWKATFVCTVPTAAAALLQRPVGDSDISSLGGAFCGSAPLPIELFKRFQEVTGVEIIEGYGLTEATCLVSCNPKEGKRKVGSVGIPLPHTKIKICSFSAAGKLNKILRTDEIGEICVSNAGINIDEVYKSDEANIGLFVEKEYLRTGDLGRLDEDGYLWITGRAKDIIIRSGENIDPNLIEEVLAGHPAVALSGAIGQPDAKTGEMPCAYVELNENMSVKTEELINFCKDKISHRSAWPKYIEIVDVLPKTAVGKIFKPDLRKKAITRIYDSALSDANLNQRILSIKEDKKLGLVAVLDAKKSEIDEKSIIKVLGDYVIPWEWNSN